MGRGEAEVKTGLAFLGSFAGYAISWLFLTIMLGAVGALVVQAITGTDDGSPLMVGWFVLVAAVLAVICFGSAWQEFKGRPRGLGLRMKRQPDGTYLEEKY